jgi:hypothetical protein
MILTCSGFICFKEKKMGEPPIFLIASAKATGRLI